MSIFKRDMQAQRSNFETVFCAPGLVLKFCLASFFLSAFPACSDQELITACADPIGSDPEVMEHATIMQILVDDQIYNVGFDFICFRESANDCFGFKLDQEQPVIQAFYIPTSGHTFGSVVDVGKKSCLAEVVERPSAGWQYSTPIYLHHGYVVKKSDGTYGRFFIDSLQKGPDGFATQVNILRQYSF